MPIRPELRRYLDRRRWLVVVGQHVVGRIYQSDLETARQITLHKFGSEATVTAWRFASGRMRGEAVRVPIIYATAVEALQAHFEGPKVIRAGGDA